MLQSMKDKKGQEEIAAFFSLLIFVAVALIVIGLLSYTSGEKKQEIVSEFKDTDLKEALLVYMMSPTKDKRIVSDDILDLMNHENACVDPGEILTSFLANTRAYFDYDPNLAWIFAISGDNKLCYVFDNKELYESKNESNYFPIYWVEGSGLPVDLEEHSVYLPNPYGKVKNIKVSLYKLLTYEPIEFTEVEA